MTSSEIDGDWWYIPATRTKTKTENAVYLTETAKELIPKSGGFTVSRHFVDRCLARAIQSAVNFPKGTPRRKGGQSYPLYVQKFVPHDLRRTHATRLADLGFSDEVINACQGRVKVGIIGTYNRHQYLEERRRAALAWERKLNEIVTGDAPAKVVYLHQ